VEARVPPNSSQRIPQPSRPPGARLSPEHKRDHIEASGISERVAAARGYFTAKRRADVPDVFPNWQRRRGLVIPTYSPSGATSYQLRPDVPRKRGSKARKYEQPGGVRCILDVNPLNMAAVDDSHIRLWIGEGVKKGDSLASRGECAISLSGVWNWQREGEPLACWDYVALAGREVYVVFDSDVMVKREVQLALERFVDFLKGRGARAQVVYLPEVADG
jgi:hypothetical protein